MNTSGLPLLVAQDQALFFFTATTEHKFPVYTL
jgi:hypothetical protein